MSKKSTSFSDKLERVLDRDDKTCFVKLLENQPTEITNTKSLLEKISELGARNCLLAWVDGKVCIPPPTLDSKSVTTLAFVTYFCPVPRVIEFMLKQCNAIPLVNVPVTINLINGLPIQFALVHLSYLEHLFFWSRGNSLIQLILLLCQWETKPILDCVHLLAQYTDSINAIAWAFVKLGALKQFGALLLVAREKVVAPFESGFTISDYLISEYNISLFDKSDSVKEYRYMLRDAQTLLNVFEVAGDSLSSYYSSMQKYVSPRNAIIDVCNLLRKARVPIDLDDLDCVETHFVRASTLGKRSYQLAAPLDRPLFSTSPAGNCTVVKHVWTPKNFLTRHQQWYMMSTTAGNARSTPQPLNHVHVNPILKHLANFAVKLKKGLRVL